MTGRGGGSAAAISFADLEHDALPALRRHLRVLTAWVAFGEARAAELEEAVEIAAPGPGGGAEDVLLTAAAIGQLLGVKESTARDLMRRGDLPVQPVGRKYKRVWRSDVLAYARRRGPLAGGGSPLYSPGHDQPPTASPPHPRPRPHAGRARGPARRPADDGRPVGMGPEPDLRSRRRRPRLAPAPTAGRAGQPFAPGAAAWAGPPRPLQPNGGR
jgi:hypothetical protein